MYAAVILFQDRLGKRGGPFKFVQWIRIQLGSCREGGKTLGDDRVSNSKHFIDTPPLLFQGRLQKRAILLKSCQARWKPHSHKLFEKVGT